MAGFIKLQRGVRLPIRGDKLLALAGLISVGCGFGGAGGGLDGKAAFDAWSAVGLAVGRVNSGLPSIMADGASRIKSSRGGSPGKIGGNRAVTAFFTAGVGGGVGNFGAMPICYGQRGRLMTKSGRRRGMNGWQILFLSPLVRLGPVLGISGDYRWAVSGGWG
ncbi:hypothetical protein KCP76_13905 [Salmonella enterica subsp. enterica serovar Weltevreden]|nr:hypothetical protein KCP76_13905 [Salmonella enterica subsp. enterica serovar Weltevreden]